MKKSLVITLLIIFIIFIVQTDILAHLQNANISYFTGTLHEQYGYNVLWLTIPLMVIQGIFTLFPIILVVMIHALVFGFYEGFLYSFIGTFFGAMICFILSRYLFSEWARLFWEKKRDKYTKPINLMEKYGVFFIVVLRNVSFMPSNLISISAALSPISFSSYFWSSVIGNLSMVWMLSLLSAPMTVTRAEWGYLLVGYIVFALSIILYYGKGWWDQRHQADHSREKENSISP
ncbi:TVP38/TMEM64 family protein [Texcoconibacillus texcoconensis]|uniref:TVP38/TMEM64 family membrane protein n=1 Tax=Texcoconibacillus texcoconensis TaxID=1095777 RepID=A0A840QT71_9BACI|nr:VTT domain-containing protein [Texcoconibacillus texcoconensis]MBB5174481.1 putative membrane protein YdjX (TVP38/TMEM64 family) [Texcoconibacillus texcoconensis]